MIGSNNKGYDLNKSTVCSLQLQNHCHIQIKMAGLNDTIDIKILLDNNQLYFLGFLSLLISIKRFSYCLWAAHFQLFPIGETDNNV